MYVLSKSDVDDYPTIQKTFENKPTVEEIVNVLSWYWVEGCEELGGMSLEEKAQEILCDDIAYMSDSSNTHLTLEYL